MIKSGIVVTAVAFAGLFAYYYISNKSDAGSTDKAKQAAMDVGDAVRDSGVAGLVDIRLKTKFGIDATRFLHSFYDNGHLVLYGLAPESMDLQLLHDEVAKVPGIASVELLVQPRPATIKTLSPIMPGTTPQPPTNP